MVYMVSMVSVILEHLDVIDSINSCVVTIQLIVVDAACVAVYVITLCFFILAFM